MGTASFCETMQARKVNNNVFLQYSSLMTGKQVIRSSQLTAEICLQMIKKCG